jgi:chitodextrinase
MAFLILMASLSVPVYSTPAHAAAVGTVGPLDPATKFPFWYQEQDPRALRLGYCFDPVFCFAGAQLPDPTKSPSVPNNFPEEFFYWDADATMPTNNGGQAFMRLGLEGAFLPGPGVVDGQQVTFGRIRFRLDNLKAGATYTITHPYGVETFVAQTGGVRGINSTTDVGCGAAVPGVLTCDFTLALNSSILQRFLTWDTYGAAVDAPPAGFIGNFSIPHRVTGSPLGTNVFRVEGPDVGGPGINIRETDLFQLSGQISGVAVTASPAGGLFNTAQAVRLTASDPAATIFFTTDGTTPTTASTKYTGTPIPITTTTTLKYMAEAQGNPSPVGAQTYTIDSVPPVVSLTATPTTPTNNASPSFTFASNKAGTTFACSLALGSAADAFSACSAPKSYSGLAAGSYTFKVRGTDPAGNVSVTPYTFTIDTAAPVVSLTATPTTPTNNVNPSFTFASNKAGTTFQCALDGAALAPCTAPQRYTALADGAHTFKVQGTDPAGNSGAVSYAFTVDTRALVVGITGKPPTLSNNANPSFTLAATKAGTTFQCMLDGAAPAACTSPQVFIALADGAHTLTVQGTDPAGNSGSASYAFTVDTTPPAMSTGLTARAAGVSALTLSWTAATDAVGVAGYQVFRDGGTSPIAIVSTGTTFTDTGLAASATHSYTVVAVDAAGNASARSVAASATTLKPPVTALKEQPKVTVRVPRAIIPHGAPVVVSVRTRPNANAVITLRLTRQGTRCTGTARQRVCKSVTTVLAQRVVHARANRQGLVTWSVPLSYSTTSPLRATLGVQVSTRYGAATHTAVVLLQPAPRARQR